MSNTKVLMDYQYEMQKLQCTYQLQLQALYNEYTSSVKRVECDHALQMHSLNNKLLQLLSEPQLQSIEPSLKNIQVNKVDITNEKEEEVKKMNAEQYAEAVQRLNSPQQPITHHKQHNPGIQEHSSKTPAIAQKILQSTQEDDDKSAEHRALVQQYSLMIEGEEYTKAVEKLQKKDKKLWIYRVNSSVNLNPPIDENTNNIIVNVIVDDLKKFDFTSFTPTDELKSCIISKVIGVGVLGGL